MNMTCHKLVVVYDSAAAPSKSNATFNQPLINGTRSQVQGSNLKCIRLIKEGEAGHAGMVLSGIH